MNPYDLAHQLSKALQSSSQFADFKLAQDRLKGEPPAREMMEDFRRQQLQLQRQMMAGLEIAPEQEEKLEKLHSVINLNTYIKEFMEAEYRLSILMRDVEKIIGGSLSNLVDPELFSASLEDLMGEAERREE